MLTIVLLAMLLVVLLLMLTVVRTLVPLVMRAATVMPTVEVVELDILDGHRHRYDRTRWLQS